MGDVINLRQARKAAERKRKDAEAEANRLRHGESKAERERRRLLETRDALRHEAGRLDVPDKS